MNITLSKSIYPENVEALLQALSKADFFSQGLLIGSWIMPIYREIFNIHYILKTFDIDFAVESISSKKPKHVNLEKIFIDFGYVVVTEYETGLRKFTKGGFEVEFLIHRRGGRDIPMKNISHLNITASPLPFIDILFLFPISVRFIDYEVRVPCPESLFIHKLIVAQRRTNDAKRENDLAQCKILTTSLDQQMLRKIMLSLKLSRKIQSNIVASCTTIDFPPQLIEL
ncbi:MAG: GSU2403 family nucleotidyltransferase fold protein [Deltaproteobacteria bacterium]|nr:GSU2403 family nucleotidyltransferase fold protein [Deltaproteobacteria bacterium]